MNALPDALLELDRKVVSAARSIRVLSTLRWPEGTREHFLASWEAGSPALPPTPTAEPHLGASGDLRELARSADAHGGPVADLIAATARSYALAGDLLGAMGTPEFVRIGRELYGHPSDVLYEGGATHREAAEELLALTEGAPAPPETAANLDSEQAAEWMRTEIAEIFGAGEGPRVELDPGLNALAAAGSIRVRLRANTRWSLLQLRQLIEHEVRVHSATKLTGKAQPLGVLGLSSPRTTQTQEGLATLAELMTDTMDLRRLRRIALRVRAIDAASDGADLIEVAQVFADAGQTREEAAASALRIFRGGIPQGGSFFLKDVVYLAGLLSAQTFLLKAFRTGRHRLVRVLFAGRMTLSDTLSLEPLVADGVLREPTTLPHWVAEPSHLAVQLALSAFHRRRDLSAVSLHEL